VCVSSHGSAWGVAGQIFVAFAPNLSHQNPYFCGHDSWKHIWCAEALQVLHMGPMSGVPVVKQVLAASVCQAIMALPEVWLVVKLLLLFHPIWATKIHTICEHESTSDAAKALQMLHMGPMSDVSVVLHVLAASVWQAMALLEVWLVKLLLLLHPIWAKIHTVCGHDSTSDAAKTLQMLHMGPMSDVSVVLHGLGREWPNFTSHRSNQQRG
jgi:hypothetical protein